MKINFLGDSITAGACAQKPENMYTYLVCKHFNAEECNFGVCGTRIAKQKRKTLNPDDDVFMNRAVKMPRDADFTFVFGGTNDYGHGDAALGKLGDTDSYTFCGAFTELVEYLINRFDKTKLCFILPLPRFNMDSPNGEGGKDAIGPLSVYIDAEKEILSRYGVEYLDLSDSMPEPKSCQPEELTEDGLHPNIKGHRVIADRLIAYLEEKNSIILKCNNNVSLLGVNPNDVTFSFSKSAGVLYDEYIFSVFDSEGKEIWSEKSSSASQSARCTELKENEKYTVRLEMHQNGRAVKTAQLDFETAFFPKKSKWIGHPENKNNVLVLTKKFTLDKNAERAKIFACGLGFFDLFVNGQKLDNYYYKPVYTDYGVRDTSKNADLYIGNKFSVCYHTYDISHLLSAGENIIEMQVANGYYNNNDKPYEPYVSYDEKKCIFEIRYSIDGKEHIVDNLDATAFYTNKTARLLRGDIIDFNLGNSDFSFAELKEAPSGEWYQSLAPCDKLQGEYYPINKRWAGDDLFVDFGYNHSGGIDCILKGEKGRAVTVKFYEYLREDGTPEYKTCAYIEPAPDGGVLDIIEQEHTYILSGGDDRITPQFNWQCYRYAVFYDARGLEIKDLKSLFIYSDIEFDAEFNSSNEIFTEITEKTLLTFKDNLHCGAISDCPHREKRPYTGDGQIVANAVIYTMDGVPFYTKWLNDILSSQIEDGYVPNTAPYGGGGGGYAWGNAVSIVPEALYRYTGNKEYAEKSYPHIVKWIEFLKNHSEDHIVTKRYKNWDLGDWLAPTTTEFNITYMRTLCYKKAVDVAIEFAGILGLGEDASRWTELSKQIANAAFERFYDKEKRYMCRNLQGESAMALALGIVPDSHKDIIKKAVFDRYSADRHFDTGIVATPLVLEYLTTNGMHDIAFDMMTATDFPSYKKMLENESTLVESWDKLRTPYHIDETDYLKPGGKPNSHCHPMFGSVMPWFYKYAAGLNLDSLYERKILFTPKYFDRLDFASASKETVFGKASAAWHKNENEITVSLSIPQGLTLYAGFKCDAPSLTAVCGGDAVKIFPKNGEYSFKLSSGDWKITIKQ